MNNENKPIGGVAVVIPVEAQRILADPKATPEEIERAYAMRIEIPCAGHSLATESKAAHWPASECFRIQEVHDQKGDAVYFIEAFIGNGWMQASDAHPSSGTVEGWMDVMRSAAATYGTRLASTPAQARDIDAEWESNIHQQLDTFGIQRESVCRGRLSVSGRFNMLRDKFRALTQPQAVATPAPKQYVSINTKCCEKCTRIGILGTQYCFPKDCPCHKSAAQAVAPEPPQPVAAPNVKRECIWCNAETNSDLHCHRCGGVLCDYVCEEWHLEKVVCWEPEEPAAPFPPPSAVAPPEGRDEAQLITKYAALITEGIAVAEWAKPSVNRNVSILLQRMLDEIAGAK